MFCSVIILNLRHLKMCNKLELITSENVQIIYSFPIGQWIWTLDKAYCLMKHRNENVTPNQIQQTFFEPWLQRGVHEIRQGRCLAQCRGDNSKHSTDIICCYYHVPGTVLSAPHKHPECLVIIISILQMRKLRFRKVKELTHCSSVTKW